MGNGIAILRGLYCLNVFGMVAFSYTFAIYNNLIYVGLILGICFFLAGSIIGLLQPVFYKTLPQKVIPLLMMTFAPYVWMLVQYLLHPFSPAFYILWSGISYTLAVLLAFAYFVVIRTFLQGSGHYVQYLKRLKPDYTDGDIARIIIAQLVFLIVPCLTVSYVLGNYLLGQMLHVSGLPKKIIFVLWVLNLGHNAFHQYLILVRMPDFQKAMDGSD